MCVCLSQPSADKTAEPVEMTFGVWTRVGRRNYVLDGARIPLGQGHLGGASPGPLRSIGNVRREPELSGRSDVDFRCQYCGNLLSVL